MFLDNIIYKLIEQQDKSSFWLKEKIFFFKELWYLINWWVWILEAVETIKDNTDNYALKYICQWIIKSLNEWKSFSHSLLEFLEYFEQWDVSIIQAWEKTWKLWKILQSLAKEYQFINQMKNKYIWALTYPAILLILWIVATIALFVFVLPWIFSITDQFPWMKLPWVTVFLQNFSNFLIEYWKYIALWTIGLIMILSIFFSTIFWQKVLYTIISYIPVVNKITQSYYLVKMSRYAKIMLEAWMNYVEVFKLLKWIVDNVFYYEMFQDTLKNLKEWWNIYEVFSNYPNIVPITATSLIKVWEKTAKLSDSFENIVEIYEDELNTSVNSLSKVVEPVMLVFIWWIVVVISLWVFGIITSIMDSVNV